MAESVGWGGKFYLHNGSALQQLTYATAVEPGEQVADEHEITPLNASNRFKTFILGTIDPGEITVELNHVPNSADDVLLLAARAAGDARAWKIVFPDDDGTELRKYEGSGFVRSYRVNRVGPNEPMTATVVIRCTGAITEAAA